jgi:predicted nucleic acid-binding Zn ribbon protein
MGDEAIKCPECGKSVPNAEILLDKQRRHKKKVATIWVTILVCILFIVGVAIANSIYQKNKTGADSYIDVLDMNLAAMIEDDPDKYLKTYPDFMRGMLEETLGSMADDDFSQYMYLLNDEIINVYGSDAAVSYSIMETNEPDDEEAQEYLDSVFEYITDYDVEDFPIQGAYELNLEIIINGSVGNQTFYTTVSVMKFDGAWYLLNIINPINQSVDDQQG